MVTKAMAKAYQKLGRYQIVREIAHGGMATVYHAILTGVENFEKDVAIKKIQPSWSSQKEFVDMLIDEARILLHLHHPNIVEVLELGKEGDVYFIVMEYVDGFDLRTIVRKLQSQSKKVDSALACFIIKQVCQGLEFAHARKGKKGEPLNIVHRDISPQNILVSCDGHVKITDFGIAKIRGKTTETAAGFLKGKFSYMSPEQASGSDIDARTDLFALGAVFYELLTGKKCFDGQSDLEIIEKVKGVDICFDQILSDDLRKILTRLLSKDTSHRYQDALTLRRDLENFEKTNDLHADTNDLRDFLQAHLHAEIEKSIAFENEVLEHTKTPLRHTQQTLPLPTSESSTSTRQSEYSVIVGPSGYAREDTPSKTTLLEKTFVDPPPTPPQGIQSDAIVHDEEPRASTQSFFAKYRLRSPSKKKRDFFVSATIFVLCIILAGWWLWPEKKSDQKKTLSVVIPEKTEVAQITPVIPPPSVPQNNAPKDQEEITSTIQSTPKTEPPEPTLPPSQTPIPHDQSTDQNQATVDLQTGTLILHARPWGYIVVEGVDSKKSPATFQLPAKSYTVHISNSSMGKSITRTVDVTVGRSTDCTAVFNMSGKTTFTCR